MPTFQPLAVALGRFKVALAYWPKSIERQRHVTVMAQACEGGLTFVSLTSGAQGRTGRRSEYQRLAAEWDATADPRFIWLSTKQCPTAVIARTSIYDPVLSTAPILGKGGR